MCEICVLDAMHGNVGTVELWVAVKRLLDKYGPWYVDIPKCEKLSMYGKGYWQGVWQTLDAVLQFPDWLEQVRGAE